MKVYLVQSAPPATRWQSQKTEAEKLRRTYGGEVEIVLVAENGRDELTHFLNGRESASPTFITRDEIVNSNTPEAQLEARRIADPDSYSAQSLSLDDAWEALPVARKLHFAALAMEAARDAL